MAGEFSGDWYPFPRLRSECIDEHEYEHMVVACVSERCNHVSAALDEHLAALGLGDDRLICAGFSQGAALAAYTGLRRRCLGVLPMGGPCPPRAALLPPRDAALTTRICVVVGDRDHCVDHAELTRSFGAFAGATVHVVGGMRHEVAEPSVTLGLEFLRACGCE